MGEWIVRPGRGLSFLEALAMWPLWLLTVGLGHTMSGPCMPSAALPALFIGAPILFAAHVTAADRDIASVTRRSHGLWIVLVVVAPIAMLGGARASGYERWIIVLGVLAALAAGLWQLELARRARRWVSGRLRCSEEGARIEAPRAIYLLAAVPSGAFEGDWITLPRVVVDESPNAGPYRSGRTSGRAPELIRGSAREMAHRLAIRGALLLAWAVLSALWTLL